MNFNIGDRVVVKNIMELPVDCRNTAITNVCERHGRIVDAFRSETTGNSLYSLHFDNNVTPYRTLIREDCIEAEPKEESSEYTVSVEVDGTVVVAVLLEVKPNGIVSEVARGHGHIIHAGSLGVAQAASYATNRLYNELKERLGM